MRQHYRGSSRISVLMPRRNTIALLLDGKPAVEGSVNQGDYVECTTSEVRPRCDDGIAPPYWLVQGTRA